MADLIAANEPWGDVRAKLNAALLAGGSTLFAKADPDSVVFTTDGATVALKAGSHIELGGALFSFPAGAAVTMPVLTAGVDYAIYLCADGVLRADANFTAPVGFDAATSRQIGGFHFSPGGNAAAQDGGDAVAAINPYSLWDLKWRPACPDPRGMCLVADSFWVDIYLLGVDHHINGTSRHGVTIADGGSPPKIPTMFGGNGTATYALTQYAAAEIMSAHGKQLLSQSQFSAAAYGVKEAAQRGTDPVATGLGVNNAGTSNADQKFTSKWGVIQATGCMWTWSREHSYRAEGADAAAITAWSWKAVTSGRGSVYSQGTVGLVAALLGGRWGNGAHCGSRASAWGSAPWTSSSSIGARGCSDHLRHV
jgi:hypothetical protein